MLRQVDVFPNARGTPKLRLSEATANDASDKHR
jgi:hypothetical protein